MAVTKKPLVGRHNRMAVSSDFSTDCVLELPAEQVEIINSFLRNHNQAANPELWAKFDDPSHDPKSLHIVTRNGADELVGGLFATTSMSWLKVEIMAVHEDHRLVGIGALMLNAAETEARRRGCKYCFLDTMDYQAPEFYRRCGYHVVGSIADWDSHDHTKFYFTKDL